MKRVLTVGGGPAGLYASLLLKKADPDLEVTVLERNPPDSTYGWGVVFSDRTLAEFREADLPTYEAITERFVLWDAIDVHYRGELVRSGGHVFAGLSRRELLAILQSRCRELGVDLRFEVEVEDLERSREHDLVIAADGVRSLARAAHEEAFGTRVSQGRSRYIWFGTPRVLDSFTFIFRENDHGLFQVHAYPFDGTTSTWIVECTEATWRRAGLDTAGESDSIRYCEKLFAEDLRGQPLLSNRSQWISFATVRNRTWRHRNVVLVGDAAHTAHFSIGSGTKLAMEDAIALARAVERRREVDAAAAEYELERRPIVERFQEAAEESRTYFENTERYRHLEPMQFAFHLLTRSGRIDYANLRERDPRYVDRVDRWFSGGITVAPPPMLTALPLRRLTLRNRVAVGAPGRDEARDGVPPAATLGAVGAAAEAGAGLVLTEPVAVAPDGRITPGTPGMWSEEHAAPWREVVARAHAAGAAVGIRLVHAGRRGATRPRRGGLDRPLPEDDRWPLAAPSPLPYTEGGIVPREMDPDDLDRVRETFAAAAELAAEAGFDVVLPHLGHGYLLGSFLSPLTNRREDDHGGDRDGRSRFPIAVVETIRASWPEDRPLGVVLQATDWVRGGWTVDDAVALTAVLRGEGCDLVEPVAGYTTPRFRPRYGPAFLAPFADRIRNEAGVATVASGGITTTVEINTIVGGARADLCVLDA